LIVGSYLPLFYAGMPPWLIYAASPLERLWLAMA
jgi:hypothetical protein